MYTRNLLQVITLSVLLSLLVSAYGQSLCLGNSLYSFTDSEFVGEPIIAESGFIYQLVKINDYAKRVGVKVHITSSYRPNADVNGAIVTPANRSNHMVGHAIDMNIIASDGTFCNSGCLKDVNQAHSSVQSFINLIQSDSELRWGGDFSTPDSVHIDDGLNLNNEALWDEKFQNTQIFFLNSCYVDAEIPADVLIGVGLD